MHDRANQGPKGGDKSKDETKEGASITLSEDLVQTLASQWAAAGLEDEEQDDDDNEGEEIGSDMGLRGYYYYYTASKLAVGLALMIFATNVGR